MNRPLPPPSATELTRGQLRLILWGVVLTMLLGALDQTIVVTALPTIGRELHDVQHLSWVVTAYLLTATTVTPLYGKLSDIHGRRLMLLVSIGVFVVGSVGCALARDVYLLIAARAFQGLGGGGLLSLGMTIISDVIAPRERGRYQAYFASIFVTSSIAGPILGGLFAEHLHWSVIFWINLPLGVLAFAMTNNVMRLLPRHERPHRLDVLGALAMAVATVALLVMLTWGGTTYPWASAPILVLAAISATAWALFWARLMSAPEPFVPLSVLANKVVRNGVGATFFAVGTMVGMSVYLPLYFEAVLGLTAGQSGLALIALMGGTVAGATTAGRVMAHLDHYKWVCVGGLALAAITVGVLAAWPTAFSLVGVEVTLVIAGIGLGTIFPVTTTSVQNAVPPYQMGTATSVVNFFRSLGAAILVAVFGAVFLASVTVGGDLASIRAIMVEGAVPGADFGATFRGVFGAASLAIAVAFAFMLAMEERPLRAHVNEPGEPA